MPTANGLAFIPFACFREGRLVAITLSFPFSHTAPRDGENEGESERRGELARLKVNVERTAMLNDSP